MSPKSEGKLRSIVRLLLGEPPKSIKAQQRDRETCLFVVFGRGIGVLTDTGALAMRQT